MMDENMTIQPIFYDTKSIYELDFTNVEWRAARGLAHHRR